MAKSFRRTIRIGGKVVNSPRFYGPNGKVDADAWYAEKYKEKDFIERGILSSSVPTFLKWTATWLQRRVETNPKSTWQMDEQRLREYLLPYLSEFPMDRITRQQIRSVLETVQRENKLSIATRTRILALASKIFNDAMNEHPPLVTSNPCVKLDFNDPRKGKKTIPTLEDWDEVKAYLKAAMGLGDTHFVACALALGAGLRKSEASALRWRNVKWKRGTIVVDSHVEQASMSILPGTKAGQDESREVPMTDLLAAALTTFKERTRHSKETDFILCDESGEWIRPRDFHDMIAAVSAKYKNAAITYHKLRHTYGRLWATGNGNFRALQQILGHASSATTEIYSEMTPKQLLEAGKGFGVGIKMDAKKNRKGPTRPTPKRHHSAKHK